MNEPSVLVIDDSPDLHALLRAPLESENLRLHHAYGSQEGLRMAAELQPDLVLLDVDMPELSGFDVCARLKESLQTSSSLVIFLTGASGTEDKVRGLDLGAVDYVVKPFEPNELRARVRAALRTKRYQDMLAGRVQIDALTGLWNRNYFDDRLGEEIAAVNRYQRALSLLIIDLDHFKGLNDAHGHPFGDRLLHSVGEVLQRLRAVDIACRYGGAEFVVLLPGTPQAGGLVCAERIHSMLAEIVLMGGGAAVPITASIGIAATSDVADENESVTGEGFLAAAAAALSEAKRSGRNRTCVSEGTQPPVSQQSQRRESNARADAE